VLTDNVTVNYSIDLRLVSDLVGAPVDEIEALNPSLLRMETPPDEPFDLHLPAGTASLFEDRVESIPEARRGSWRYHLVQSGDTMASVAHEYRIEPSTLARANQLTASDGLQGVTALVVPVAPEAARSLHRILYTVRRGDTLITIADRFGVSLTELRRWNHISGTRVEPGRRLHVAEPAPVRHSSRSRRRREQPTSQRGHARTRTHSSNSRTAAEKKKSNESHSKTASKAKSRSKRKQD
jgi:membrane-bound lytic murein transglycosylase D